MSREPLPHNSNRPRYEDDDYTSPSSGNVGPIHHKPGHQAGHREPADDPHGTPEQRRQAVQEADAHPKWHDMWWVLAFVIHLVIDVILFAVGLYGFLSNSGTTSGSTTFDPGEFGSQVGRYLLRGLGIIVLGGFVACAFAAIWLSLLEFIPKTMIYLTGLLNAALLIVGGVVLLVLVNVIAGIVLLCCGAIFALLFLCCVRRIKFAAVILSNGSHTIRHFYGLPLAGIFFMILGLIWWVVWVVGAGYTLAGLGELNTVVGWIATVYLIFSAYWVANTFGYVVYLTVAGVVGTWFFLGDESMPRNPSLHSLRRACTFNLGTALFAAFLIAVIQTLRTLANMRPQDQQGAAAAVVLVLLVIARCLLACLQGIIEYINSYALVYAAVFNLPFVKSAKETFHLLRRSGMIAVINDNYIGPPVAFGGLLGGLLAGGVCLGLSFVVFRTATGGADLWPLIVVSVIGLILGLILSVTLIGLVTAAVRTLFVCTAEAPETLRTTHPEIWTTLVEYYGEKLTFTDQDLFRNP